MTTKTAFLAITLLTCTAVSATAETAYPLSIENCGLTVVFERPPERVVTIKSTATELLLALGLADRIVGIGFQDGPVPPAWSDDAAGLTVLSDKLPSQEVVLEAEPDFIYGGWESNFVPEGAGDRPALAALNIDSYVSPAACRSVKPAKLSVETLFEDFRELADIFDAEAAVETLIAAQKRDLLAVTPDTRGLSAVWYSSGTKTPYVGAGNNAPAMMLQALGLANIMAAVDEGWVSASWEAIVDADPDVIVLVDAAWNTAEQKRQLLAENPVTSRLDAVIHQRYLVVPFPASEAGVRTVGATLDMARQLAALSFSP